jgi:deoxyribodipyrimidine photo-lyase
MIEDQRIKKLNTNEENNGPFVFYWMQQSQRTHYNHALEYAIMKANQKNKPLVVYFGITDQFPDANLRHYRFMILGLRNVQENLTKKNIGSIIHVEHPVEGILNLSTEACLIIVDRGYLRVQKKWRQKVSKLVDCPLIQVESDVIVPVETTSPKEEYAAYTIRPKIHRNLSQFLTKLSEHKVKKSSIHYDFSSINLSHQKKINTLLQVDSSVPIVSNFTGGESQAKQLLDYFLKYHIKEYDNKRNDPFKQATSQMSPYLHFGQISPVYIALEVKRRKPEYANSFLEELIVRRELSMNFVHYNELYDQISCLPEWAFNSLQKHKDDKREYIYSLDELENASTHDAYWNTAQQEMKQTGKMHGYMRMYWGKKILEWTQNPSDAFEFALYLNNRYELDGRDPNGFTGVAWCFGKHDRAWKERSIFGKIRYMSQSGLKRKIDLEKYVSYVEKKCC